MNSYMKTCITYDKHLAELFLDREMFQTKVVEKIKTHIYLLTYLLHGADSFLRS